MTEDERSLHGNAPDKSDTVLLIIDMINDLEFPDGETLRIPAEKAAENIADLKKNCMENNVPVVFVNDNFGRWKSDFRLLIDHCLKDGVKGEKLTRLLLPEEENYFVLKPKHSGFYSTSLDILLEHLEAKRLIITGITADICVYFTASDAYMRGFDIIIPADCVASVFPEQTETALGNAERILKAEIADSKSIKLV